MSNDTEQYYPTPKELIEKMLKPYEDENGQHLYLYDKKILEPSAGKGNIIEYIKDKNYKLRSSIDVCEINPKYREELEELSVNVNIKGYDFLEYNPDVLYDLIIMNPPFNNGAKHFLHAWDISNGAEIICLLNAETLKNDFSKERDLINKIIEDNGGTIEYIQNAFTHAERKSNVEIALIRVKKKEFNFFDMNIEFNQGSSSQENIDFNNINEVMTSDVFVNNEIAFNKSKEALKKFIIARKELVYYTNMLFDTAMGNKAERRWDHDYTIHRMLEKSTSSYRNNEAEIYNKMIDDMRVEAWENLTSIPKINKMLSFTSKQHLDKLIKEQKELPYTAQNMMNIYIAILKAIPNIRKQVIIDSFDWLTTYYEENRVFVEGWKTNDSWKVNSRCILPNTLKSSWKTNTCDSVQFDTGHFHQLEKACQYLLGEDPDIHYLDKRYCKGQEQCNSIEQYKEIRLLSAKELQTTSKEELKNINYISAGEKLESRFFIVKLYKKGTVHLEWKDKKLHDLFNYIACNGKNWLPQKDKKEYAKKYKNDKTVPQWVKEDMGLHIEDKQDNDNDTLLIEQQDNEKVFENTGTLFFK